MRTAWCVVLAIVIVPVTSLAAPAIDLGGDSFRKGARTAEIEGAYIQPIRFSESEFYQVNGAAGYYFGDAVALNLEVGGSYVDQPDDDTAMISAGLLLRWHFLRAEHYSLFVDGGVGVNMAEAAVPEFGTHFNYTGKGGVGATIRLREDLHLIGGARFFHLSNANLHGRDQNPSHDGVQYYLGVMFTL